MTNFKTTHVGSLPRPPEMIARTLRKQAIGRDDLKGYLADIMERQLSLGISCINNGELPRADYVNATIGRIAGFGGSAAAPIPHDLEDLPDLSRRFGGRNGLITLNPKAPIRLPACSQPLAYTGAESLRDELEMMTAVYEELRPSHADTQTALFFTSPSPGTVALFMENQYYPTDEAYLENVAEVLRREYEIIASYGVHLQIDCPDLAMGRHTRFKHLGDEAFLAVIETHVRVLNQALANLEPDRCRMHVCWGNYPGTHHRDIDFKTIFQRVMGVNVRYVSVEAGNPRHAHEWTVFEEFALPEDKVLMPGVIDTSVNTVEHPDLVAWRIGNYARLLGRERVIASTDCGFATTAVAAAVSGDAAWLKLASLVEGARRASDRFA